MRAANRLRQHEGIGLFDEVTRGTEGHGLLDVNRVSVRGKHQHLGVDGGLHDLPRGFHAIDLRHGDVHDDHIRTELASQRHSLTTVLGFSNDMEIGLCEQQVAQYFADDAVVFCQEDGDEIHCGWW